ncbi:MAG: AAA family ATPase [Thermosipho sp. (in: Bacteria)]|nr:AAA family ATPase [Thermosipho sp. (in: thermotogales)]
MMQNTLLQEVNKNILAGLDIGESLAIEGIIKKQIFSADNGYSVYLVGLEKQIYLDDEGKYLGENIVEAEITVCGYFTLMEGQRYQLRGQVSRYKNKKQITLTHAEYVEPNTEDDIIAFLASDLIKGIGEKTAEKLVKGYIHKGKYIEGFGEKTLEIIKNNFKALTKIHGISEKKARQIHESYMKNIEYQNVMMFFQKFGLSPKAIMKIYAKFKEQAIEKVMVDPFVLEQISGFGFKICNSLCLKLGTDPHNITRIKSCIKHTLYQAANEGHCYLTDKELLERVEQQLSITISLNEAKGYLISSRNNTKVKVNIGGLSYTLPYKKLYEQVVQKEKYRHSQNVKIIIDPVMPEEILTTLEEMLEKGELSSCKHKKHLCIYLNELYKAELETAAFVRKIQKSKTPKVNFKLVDQYIADFEKKKGFKLEEKQKLAVKTALTTNIAIIYGPAGSGKTTVIEAIIYVLGKILEKPIEFILSATTGRAAKRLTEVTGYEAKTIHRALGFNPFDEFNGFTYNEINPLPYDLVIADEVSMLEITMARNLLSAIDTERGAKIILIGDHFQLPAIGPGNVLKDLIESRMVQSVRLDVVKRQQEDSGIVKNANRILTGKPISTDNRNKDFFLVRENNVQKIADKIVQSVANLLSKDKYSYSIDDIQVISPQKAHEIGVEMLNNRLQNLVNPPSENKKSITRGSVTYRVGDRVIHTNTNDYKKIHYEKVGDDYVEIEKGVPYNLRKHIGVANGEIGRVVDIRDFENEETGEIEKKVIVQFDSFYAMYDKSELKDLELAYVLTVHRAQGSQYKVVIMPVHLINKHMLNRSLGYTAITRAKEIACLIGQPQAVKLMTEKVVVNKRNTLLKDFLKIPDIEGFFNAC